LGTTYADSYLLHSPFPALEQTLEAWQVLGQLQAEGKVRLIGVCNTYDVGILAALDKARKVQVVQNRWYEGNAWDQKVFNYCKENGIMYQQVFMPTLLAIRTHRDFCTDHSGRSQVLHPFLVIPLSCSWQAHLI
jgi:diketogulonate reductase-like aldo/keto reductase